jgi:PAS domain S-box-containing protein
VFSSPAGREELKKKRVLIVEDDEIFRRFLKDHLSNKPGLTIVGEAEDGRKALEQAETLKPDLVLMDSRMPRLNGFKASRLLLDKMPRLRIIILAVFNNPKDKQAAEECGACGYVQKLNIMEELLPAIRAAFRASGNRKMPIKKKVERPKRMAGASGPPYQYHPDPEKVERLLQASLESEHKYKSLVDKSLLGIYMTQNHILKFCNSRFAEMFNYSGPEAMIGLHIRKLVAPESWDTVDREVKLRESGQKEFSQYEFRAIRRDGRRFEAEVLGSRIQYEGQPAVQGMMIDITERKRSERLRNCLFRISEAAAASSTLDDLFHSIHLNIAELMPANNFYIALFDPDGQTISFPYFRDEFDTAPARKKPGKGLTEYVLRTGEPLLASPDVFDELERRGEVESMGTPSIDWLGVPLRIEGQARGVLVVQSYTRGVRYTEADKAILKFVSDQVAQAIARKQAESAVQDRERFLAGIFDSIQDGLSVLDLNFTILRVNQTMEEWFAPARPLVGKKCYEAYQFRKTECESCPMRKTLLTSKAAFGIVPKVGPGGEAVGWLGLYSFPFRDQASGRMKGVIEFVRDITDQKRAEEQIRLDEARLQSLYNISQYKPKDMRELWDFALEEAISLTGSKVGWLGAFRADRQTLSVISWSREIIADSRIKDRPTEFPIEKGGIWAEAIRSGEALIINNYKAEDPRKKGIPPGHLEIIRLLAMPVSSEDKTVYLVVAANKENDYDATDVRQLNLLMDSVLKITERKKAEEATRLANERLQFLMSSASAAIYSSKAEGHFPATFISDGIIRMTGHEPEEFLKNPDFWYAHIHPEDRFKVDTELPKLFEKDFYAHQYRFQCHDGNYIWVHDEMRLIRDDKGHPLEIIGLCSDITEGKRAEEALQRSEEKYRELVENLNEVIYTITAEGTITYISPTAQAVLGYAPAELIGTDFALLVFPDDLDRIRGAFADILRGRLYPSEYRMFTKSGEVRWVRTSSRPVTEGGLAVGLQGVLTDVTERKQAEEALRESEERFRTLFENATIGIYRTMPDGRILLANPALVRMLGYSSFEELERRNLEKEGFPPDFPRGRFRLMIEKEGEVRGLESAWKRADGSVIYIRESAKVIRDAEGKVLYYEGTVEDITERRQAEEALHHSEEQYRTLVESLNEVIISLDLEGKFDYVSPAVERLFQYKVSELIGKPFAQFIHPDDLPDLMYRVSEALKGETRPYVFRILDKDGEIKFIRTHSQPIMKEGKPAGLTGLLEDVTKRKRAEEALKKSEERFKLLFAFAPDAYFLLDLNGRLLDSNNAAQVLTGHKQEEAVGRTFIDLRLLPPSQKENAAALMEKNIMGLPTGPDEMVLSRQDGTEIHVEIRTFPIKVEGAIQILWIVRDIAGRKALENEADKRIAELEEFYKMAVNRELRMIELKNEIEKLNAELARLGGGLEKRV